jgi:hypothetical protein
MGIWKACGLAALAAAVAAGAGANAGTGDAATAAPAQPASAGKRISFGGVDLDPLAAGLSAPTRYQAATDGRGLRFVQFDAAIRGDWLGDLRAAGLRPLQYYPHDTYLVWGDADASRAVGSLANVRWQGEYRPEWKLEPGLAKRSGLIGNVAVHFYNDGDVDAVLAALRANGARVLNHGPAQSDHAFFDAWIELDATRLDAIADLPQVVWLEYASPKPILDDEMSSQILARNYDAANVPQTGYLSWLTALGYDGSGLTWAIIDTGIDYSHPDFAGRITGGTNYAGCPGSPGNPGDDAANGGHGTHVAGIVGGDGAAGHVDAGGFLYGMGMAAGVGFHAQNPICNSSSFWPPTGGWQVLARDALLGGAIGGNASWTSGESGGTTYTAGARAWDQLVRDGNVDTPLHEAFTMVFSAGNAGPGAGSLTAPKAAKNPIITGGTQNFRVSGNIDAIYNASSRGPTQDGRFGITIAAPGQQIASAMRRAGASQCASPIAGTANHYAFCSGTSMAAPHASGAAVLLSDWWRENNGGVLPSPAMIKALLVNGAKDVPGAPPIPNATEGWGRVDVPGSMGLDFTASEYVDQSEVLDGLGEVYEVTYGVVDPSLPLKVSLAWTDAAAAAGANPALVNNLDLEVETGGVTYLGNVFADGMSTTGGSADSLNNVENVFVAAPGSSVTIRVRATNLPGDGIPGMGSATDQDFALVCRNCVTGAGFTMNVTPAMQAICAAEDAAFDIEIGSLLGYDEPVQLGVTGQPMQGSAVFTVNPVVPPGTSQLVISGTGAIENPFTYAIWIRGESGDQEIEALVELDVDTALPDVAMPALPADGAIDVPVLPTLEWTGGAQSQQYRLEVSSDAAFGTLVVDEIVTGTSFTPSAPLDSSSTYYWRVTASNACGIGDASAIHAFRTIAAPGDCDIGTEPVELFAEDFSAGMNGFSTEGSTGASTWAISTRPGSPSGGNTVRAIDITTVSDQRLVSPPVELPADESPLTLQFWNDQTLERGGSGCFDGGVLEISSDGGATWDPMPDAALLVGSYDGPIDDGYSNPLADMPAWCGDPREWQNYVVALDAWAGETVQFRWRLGTDSSQGRPDGWHLDDIKVQSCVPVEPLDRIFASDFEP